MSDRTTINVSKEARDVAREAKRDGETWGDYLRRCADVDTASTPGDMDAEALANELARRLDYAELANMTAEELEARLR